MSSGIFRTSSMTVPAFSMRSTSLFLSAAGGAANVAGAMRSKLAARYFESCMYSSLVWYWVRVQDWALFAIASNDDDSADQGDDTQDRRKWNRFVFFLGSLDRADV